MQPGAWSTRICTFLVVGAVGSSLLQRGAGALAQERPAQSLAGPAEAGARRVADYGLPNVDLFLRAARPLPPGLTARRTSEREEERAAAVSELNAVLASGAPQRKAWIAAVGALLSSPAAGAEIWSAAAAWVAEFEFYELDEQLLAGLDADAAPLVQHAAVEALRRLYGLRPVPGEPFVRPFEPNAGTRHLLAVLSNRDERDLANRAALFAIDAGRAFEAVGDPDPVARAEGARVTGGAAAAGELDAGPVRAALLERLGMEVDPAAFKAVLDALLMLTVGLAHDGAEVAAVRSVLLRLAGEAPEVVLLSLAHGLAVLPWSPGSERPEANLRAAERHLARLLGRVAAAPHADQDVTTGILRALEDLLAGVESATRAEGSVEDGAWVRGCEAREPLLSLLASERAVDSVRRAAAETLGRVALAEDIGRVRSVLSAPDVSAGLRYAILGTLGALAQGLDGEAGPIVDTLFAHLDDADADLRRRALAVLSSPGLAHALEGRDLSRLVARLEEETVQELRLGILALLRTYGGAELLEPILSSASFDEFASGDPLHVRALAQTLEELSGGDPVALLASARRLAEVTDPSTGVARLIRSLDLVALLGAEAAAALTVADHDRIVAWARRVRSGGASFSESSSQPERLLRRLVDVHLPGLAEVAVPSEAEREHTAALFLGDLVMLRDDSLEQAALDAFAHALELAEGRGEVFLAARVRRDRARFARDRGRNGQALADLRALIASSEASGVLELSDLRALAELLGLSASREVAPAESSPDVEAFAVLRGLVARDVWRGEPGAVRLNDLRTLGEHALATRDAGRLERIHFARALLEGLPAVDVELEEQEPATDAMSAGPPPIWEGLERESAWRADLIELRARLDEALLGEPRPAVEAPVEAGSEGRSEEPKENEVRPPDGFQPRGT